MNVSQKLSRTDIESIINRIPLDIEARRVDSTGWITIASPLRDDGTRESFRLNVETGAWKDFGGGGESGDIVELIKLIQGVDTKKAIEWIDEQIIYKDILIQNKFSNNSIQQNGISNQEFWITNRLQLLKGGMARLNEERTHELLLTAHNYDCLKVDTMIKYGCGIINQWGKEWLAFPYVSGCQLYRREDGTKVIRSLKDSSPGNSFFGLKQTNGSKFLIIAKSPRECMLLSQEFGDQADVIGLCTGEQGKLSKEQESVLISQISTSNYSKVYTFLDCDTDSGLKVAQDFAETVNVLASQLEFKVDLLLVNIHKATGGAYKDITDCIRDGMQSKMIDSLLSSAESINNIKSLSITPKKRNRQSINSTTNLSIIDDILDHKNVPLIPDDVYCNLPDILQTRCSLIEEPHRRDVFLMACLPVIASHMTNVLTGHADGYYSPDLFTLVVADPGAGKGIAGKAKKLGHNLNKFLIENSHQEKSNWQQLPEQEKANTKEPKERVLFIPANSSSRAIYDCLEANGGSGLLFETEIDTLLNASGQEWGNFSDITRKAFHHETVSINRKNERFFIEEPRLSIFISGTFDQFKMMFESAENGHFSRYALYTFDVPRIWKSHRPAKNSLSLDDSMRTASEALFELYKRLKNRERTLYINLNDEQWQMIDDTFSEKMQIIEELDLSPYLHASNNRAAVLALRLISMFTVLRNYQGNPKTISENSILSPIESDMVAGLWLADTFIKHAIRLYQILPKATDTHSKGDRYNRFIAKLPISFETSHAINIGEELGIPESTIKRWLRVEEGLKRIKHGCYEKNTS